MDYTNRSQHQAPPPPPHHIPMPHHAAPPPRKSRMNWVTKELRYSVFVVIVGCALILSILSFWLAVGPTHREFDLINKKGYQAVFLNGGFSAAAGTAQPTAYFGHITKLNDKYFVLRDIYYITTTGTTQPTTSSLVKLGCEQLHAPYDQMVINRDQVAYWENLQDSGKVVQAIDQYKKQNPNGPKCDTSTDSSNSSTPAPTNTTAPTNTQRP